MNIWQLKFDVDNYSNLEAVPPLNADALQSFNGTSKLSTWTPIKVVVMEDDKSLSDAPGFIIPVFSQRALGILLPLIENSVEVLNINFNNVVPYYAINVTSVLDVINYSESEYKTYRDGKRILAFKKYSFKINKELTTHNIFKIIDEPTRNAFVSDKFKEAVEKNNLSGFVFKKVWSSE